MKICNRLACLTVTATLFGSTAFANSGPAIVAEPAEGIIIDGDLSDWPETVERQALWHFDFEVSDRPAKKDASATLMAAIDWGEQALFIALDVTDDVIVTDRMNERLPNGLGTNPDGVLLYLDLAHRARFSENMEFSFVSRPIAAADNALLPEGIVIQERPLNDQGMTAEWRIDLPALFEHQGFLKPDMIGDVVVGFDALYFDRDSESDGSIIKWTVGPNDGQDNTRLGDLFVLRQPTDLVRIEGRTAWAQSDTRPPMFAHLVSEVDPSFVVRGKTHPDGTFHIKAPPGVYRALASDSRSLMTDAQPISVELGSKNLSLADPVIGVKPADELATLVPALMEETGTRAVGVAWIRDGKTVFNTTFGVEADGDAATTDTRFRVASITKTNATMTVLSLVEDGLWDLNTPLAEHWVDPDVSEDPRHLSLTTEMALRHLTGLPNWRGGGALAFVFDPGSRQSYSGEGFEYMRRAMEAALEKDLEDLATERVFRLAGMVDTSFRWSEDDAGVFAGEYFGTGTPVPHYRGDRINAAANLLSTPTDLARLRIGCWRSGAQTLSFSPALKCPIPIA